VPAAGHGASSLDGRITTTLGAISATGRAIHHPAVPCISLGAQPHPPAAR